MTVRAKFKCVAIEASQTGYGDDGPILKTVKLRPVYGNTEDPTDENGRFFKYTPSGEISLGVLNEAASSQFELGKAYYVDFTPAE